MYEKLIGILSVLIIVLNSSVINAQIDVDNQGNVDRFDVLNTITTAVPFLLIALTLDQAVWETLV